MAESAPQPAPSDDDERKRLEHVLEEIALREAHEKSRQSTSDSKLTSALAILPIIVGLSTTAYFEMLPHAARFGPFGFFAAFAFFVAILCFFVAALYAITGLWPNRGQYSVVALGTIRKYLDDGTYHKQLRHMISERAQAVKADGAINAEKLGHYMTAQKWIVAGLGVLALLSFGWFVALMVSPSSFIDATAKVSASGSPSPSPSPSPAPPVSPGPTRATSAAPTPAEKHSPVVKPPAHT